MQTSEIREFIRDNVFTASAIKAFTENLFDYELLFDGETSLRGITWNTKINYLTCSVKRVSKLELCDCVTYNYFIDFTYTREKDLKGESEHKIQEMFEQLESTIVSTGGKTLDGLVDSIDFNSETVKPSQNQLEGKAVLVGIYTLKATLFTNLG